LPSFGEKLKQEREKRKITLEQISVSTKIGTRMLQALEEDKFNQLPGGIFNKGFVRAYARAIGIDEDQTVAEYLQASGDPPPVPTEIAPRDDAAREAAERISRIEATNSGPVGQLPWLAFAAVLLVVALARALFSHRRDEIAPRPVRPKTVSPPTVAGKLPSATPEATSDSGTVPLNGRNPNPNPGSSPPAQKSIAESATQIAGQDEFRVVVHIREQSWISTTVDGETTLSETLNSGSDRSYRGHSEIVVKVGNAGGVDLRFNGKEIDLGGQSGEVKTITFGPQGIMPNASAPPNTP
jgi:cytoskeleton protein RodZ